MVAGLLLPLAPAPLPAAVAGPASIAAMSAVADDFDPGYIISDANFFDPGAMSEVEIQAFLNARVPNCGSGATCLKNFSQVTVSRPATPMCAAYTPDGGAESAARIIWKVAQACGISPKVILVTLQKEQGLVTATNPSAAAYRYAMGADCPDTPIGCDVAFAGFFIQVHRGAYLMKRYTQPPGTGAGTIYTDRFDLRYPVGVTTNILYSPNCSTTRPVAIRNQATHVLYIYTPYTPNGATMQYLYGAVPKGVDGYDCASYGNRNFWRYFTDWFGSPTQDRGVPYGAITSVSSTTAGTFTIHGWAVDPDRGDASVLLNVFVGDGYYGSGVANLTDSALTSWYTAFGTAHAFDITISGAPPGDQRVCVQAVNTAGSAGYSPVLPCVYPTISHCGGSVGCPSTVDRIAGADRYAVAVDISKRAYPSGTDTVYVTSGLGFADALSAAPAAARDGAPLLLTDPNFLPSGIGAEITRLGPDSIVVVGGPASVSDAVLASLTAIAPTSRVSGVDRFEASRNIAASFGHIPDLYLATGLNFPDALSAGSVGAYQGRPVVLVNGAEPAPDSALLTFLQVHGVQRITIAGGPASVPESFATALTAAGYTVSRLTGPDRFTVSVAASAAYSSADVVYVASGLTYPDALTGSVLAAKESGPLLLSSGNCLIRVLIDRIHQLDPDRVTFLGGESTQTPSAKNFTQCA